MLLVNNSFGIDKNNEIIENRNSYVYLEKEFIFNPLVGSRRIWIYLPPDYSIKTDKKHPVLYIQDGQNIFENGGFGSWSLHKVLDEMYLEGKNVGIVVAIDNSPDRLKEYTPFPNTKYTNGEALGTEYLQALVNNIIPYINANYRTYTDREKQVLPVVLWAD